MAINVVPPDDRHRPHDLLWVDDAAALIAADVLPAWATSAWLAAAPAVVRRAAMRSDDRVPVGLRGSTRTQRCAAYAIGSRVIRKVTPEDLAKRALVRSDLADSPLPCLRTLARIAPSFGSFALAWGVTGSVGFMLASGFDLLRAESDLDLVVRAPDRGDTIALRAMVAIVQATECRVDVQVETARGAFALSEWARTGGPVLLKTSHGPVLCADPWDAGSSHAESSALA